MEELWRLPALPRRLPPLFQVALTPVAGPTSFTDTWGRPAQVAVDRASTCSPHWALEEIRATGGDIRRVCELFYLSISAAIRCATTVGRSDDHTLGCNSH